MKSISIMSEPQKDFFHWRWPIRPMSLARAEDYYRHLDDLSFAKVGLLSAWDSNYFFDESCQLIANAIYLFQEGFFDSAFYSLRQSIETSICSHPSFCSHPS